MEESKYYIPSIEEFYVGFEFEYYNGGEWSKRVFPGLLFFDSGEWVFCLEDCLNRGSIRVKYLDKEDIESLGWIFEKEHPGMDESFYSKNLSGKSYDYLGIDHDTHSNYFRIYYCELLGDSTIFSGKIKNKSDLIRLIKQLGVNE